VAIYPEPMVGYGARLQRYGFHGISHQYCAQRGSDFGPRLIATTPVTSPETAVLWRRFVRGQSIDHHGVLLPGGNDGQSAWLGDPGSLCALARITPDQLDETPSTPGVWSQGILQVAIGRPCGESLGAMEGEILRAQLAFGVASRCVGAMLPAG